MSNDPTVALFVTCLVDQFFPQVGKASVRLMEQAGFSVEFPREQTCCGQPAFNMGLHREARELAKRFLRVFEPFDTVVAPSGSCTSMVRRFYPELFEGEPEWKARAARMGERTLELTEFLSEHGFQPKARFEAKLTYQDSCHLLRELGLSAPPRELLRKVDGVELVELGGSEVCCGFGGAFSAKLPELSEALLEDKLQAVLATGAEVVTATDCGCLMHLGGALRRRRLDVRALHIAEILAGEL